jgi:hypothetical protein
MSTIDRDTQVTEASQLIEGQALTYSYAGLECDGEVDFVHSGTVTLRVPKLESFGRGAPTFDLDTSLDVDTGDHITDVVTASIQEDEGTDFDALNQMGEHGILEYAQSVAEELGIENVTFKFSSSKRSLGRAKASRDRVTGELFNFRITLSRAWFVDIGMPRIVEAMKEEGCDNGYEPEAFLDDVIRHELAHVLNYIELGKSDHGPDWKAACARTGANPNRTCDVPDSIKKLIAPWMRVCRDCGQRIYYYGKPKSSRKVCGSCYDRRTDEGGRFDVVRNPNCVL